MMNDNRKLVNIKTAMALVSVSRRTIYNWMALGRVEWLRTAGGSRRIYIDTLFSEPVAIESAPVLRAHDIPALKPFPEGPLIPPNERTQFERCALAQERANPVAGQTFRPYPRQASVMLKMGPA